MPESEIEHMHYEFTYSTTQIGQPLLVIMTCTRCWALVRAEYERAHDAWHHLLKEKLNA